MSSEHRSSENQNTASQGVSRRAAIGAGAAAAGFLLSDNTALAETPKESLRTSDASFNVLDPLVTIDYSGLKARVTSTGVTWAAETIPTDTIPSSQVSGFTKRIGFVAPDASSKVYVDVPFQAHMDRIVPLMTPARRVQAASSNDAVFNTAVLLFKLCQNASAQEVRAGKLVSTGDEVVLSGNISLSYVTAAVSDALRKRLDAAARTDVPETVPLHVSKLLATPLSGVSTTTFNLDHFSPFGLRKDILTAAKSVQILHSPGLTSDGGANIYTLDQPLDVTKLLSFSMQDRNKAALAGISISDVATAVQVASWVLAAADASGNYAAQGAAVSGSITIGVAF